MLTTTAASILQFFYSVGYLTKFNICTMAFYMVTQDKKPWHMYCQSFDRIMCLPDLETSIILAVP